MGKLVRQCAVLFLFMTVVTGVLYPLITTGLARAMFSGEANGSLVRKDGRVIGSALVGQAFTEAKYFWSRPSATSPGPDNGASSSGSNLGPTHPALTDAAKQRMAALRAADPTNTRPVPVDLVTASGSGLDPEISPAAAEYQVGRVARARGLDPAKVREVVAANTRGRQLGVLGEPRVNVLELNLALDGLR
ncbi:potassium-transporting ATPase subunit KdpC [Luteibacter sp. CQ10]|uniref:potassium-transporting ATPase subunit KdpC n=1 Tax=Luteibacter sp. CQ10 TaxID=2805821 RepID=UPI0034A23EE1